jgi:AmiR/NasT family two-component response regulator
MTTLNGSARLRVLIANRRPDHLAVLGSVIEALGHEVAAEEVVVGDVGADTARLRPDVALVGLGDEPDHALELISAIVREAYCPVIALIPDYDAKWIEEAARRGIFGYIVDARPEEIQSAIDIALSRFVEHAELTGAFNRRNLALQQQLELLRSKQALLLGVQDGILQQLTTASLGLQLGEVQGPLSATGVAIERAKAIVSQTIEELLASGSTLDDVLRDSVPH